MTTSEAYYAAMADRMDRDPVQGPDTNGRATVPMGQGFAMWRRFNPNEELTWINDADGTPRALTPKQKAVWYSISASFGTTIQIRSLAADLNVSPSTISRAMVKLASFGLIAYLTGRGRYGGSLIVRRGQNDGLERFRKLAKAKLRTWAKAAEERVSRLKFNVATRYTRKEIEEGVGGYYLPTYYSSMDATLQKPWTPEELREAGII
jgi:DNA-binding MarR family transcriptional regulator